MKKATKSKKPLPKPIKAWALVDGDNLMCAGRITDKRVSPSRDPGAISFGWRCIPVMIVPVRRKAT